MTAKMKNFSINFCLTKKDYRNFYKTINQTLLLQRLKYLAITLTVSVVFAFFKFYSLAVTSFFTMFILFFIGDIVNITYILRMNDRSRIGKRRTTIDFYNDHFEIINYPFLGSFKTFYIPFTSSFFSKYYAAINIKIYS